MDSKQLKTSLADFEKECRTRNLSLSYLRIKEAYPGDSSTSYLVEVSAPWFSDITCSEALDLLIDILWDTTTIEIRTSIHAIKILYNDEVIQHPIEPNYLLQ